ncbi:uncharacterized protein H6S33_002205 [Morchella sextelata]|uniref:uncharacterized protein n=1 Tax=Morchella sextelata TaxID=1174677 RepID=UPI001D0569CC|nr:uncharacterized protein H6S33_002205 [Morchella sextelata]KAH0608153.1 hypothetical protein H6S33_002205 [Morchella sextelata]
MTAPPDASQLTKWEDAFQHPIPVVRGLERQLQTELGASKEKLRGLVGESYRDLLRTAERIVEMDRDAQKVESCLAETSRACSSRLLERKARNLRMFEERVGAEDREKYVFAAQLAVLGSCPSVVSRLLQRDEGGENCLLATKVFVVLRLLLKSLLQKGPSVPLLESLKHQRTTLTAHLTTHIDHLLTTATPHLTTVLTSYSLLKTSSPSDVLRHFLYIRSSAISTLTAERTPKATLAAMALYNQTLAHADALFPKRLSDALILLKSRPLFADPALTQLPDLALDTHASWLPDELSGFVPWVRHDDLERARVAELAAAWGERELLLLNEGVEGTLAGMEDLGAVVGLRAEVLALWGAGERARRPFAAAAAAAAAAGGDGLGGGRQSERLRELVGARIAGVVRAKSARLAEVGARIKEELEGVGTLEDSTSLWDPVLLSIPLTAGGALFKESVQSRVHGKNSAIKSFRATYDAFLSDIAATTTTLHSLRSPPTPTTTTTTTTTAAATDDADDDFDAEEQRAQEALEDSLIAETELRSALDAAYRALETTLDRLVDSTTSAPTSTTTTTTTAATRQTTFLLRTIRQIRQHPTPLCPLPWFCSAQLPRLHSGVAALVGRGPAETVGTLLRQRRWSGVLASRALWEGSPPLPVQPSPLVFKFLLDLVGGMHEAGDDVWTPAAVRGVKVLACQELWGALEGVVVGREVAEVRGKEEGKEGQAEGEGGEKEEGEKEEEEGVEAADEDARVIGKDWAVQLLFDALYLDEALQRKGANARNSGISSLAGKIEATVGIRLGFDEELRRRLEGCAREYWKRTCLLFGLLS